MADIIIHIGLNKTGTSSIQDFMTMNAPSLLAQGVCYPVSGRETAAHHALSYWIKKLPDDADVLASEPGVALRAEIAQARLAVISSEDLHTQGPRGVRLLARLFEGHRVRVVLYLREHLAYLTSWYQQNVQASHLSSAFDTFCHFTRTPFHVVADRWAEVFGRDKLSLCLYDRSSLVGGDIVRDFARHIGLGDDLSRFTRKPFESNPSVTGNLLFAKRVINNFLDKPTAAGLNDEITALSTLRPEFRGALFVDERVGGYVTGMYAADRAKLLQRYDLRIEPWIGARPGQAMPRLASLADDWELLRRESLKRSFAMANFLRVLKLGDLSALGAQRPALGA